MVPEQPLRRYQLQTMLEDAIGTSNVYFEPPPNTEMQYPCIVYVRDSAVTRFAGNFPYRYTKRYQVTVIDQDPDSKIPDKVAALPTSVFRTHFKAGNLNHDVFTIFF